jgi:hypothetical protein
MFRQEVVILRGLVTPHIFTQRVGRAATRRDPYMIDTDACVHSQRDLKQLHAPEPYCLAVLIL